MFISSVQINYKPHCAQTKKQGFHGQNEKLIQKILTQNPKSVKINYKIIERTLNFLGLKPVKNGGTHVRVPLNETEHEIFIIEHGSRKTSHFTEVLKLKKIIERFYKPKEKLNL